MGLRLLPLDFSLILPVVSRLSQLYSTDNKTSRLMVKGFSTMSDTQRCSQSYMKKRRGRREIEMSRRRKRGTQVERDRSTQLSVPKVFSVGQIPTEIHRIGLEYREKGENRGDLREKMESQMWERVINTLLSKNGYWILDS